MTIRSTLLAGTAVFAFGAAAAPVFAQSPAQPLIQVAQAAPPALVNAIAAYRDAQAAVAAAEDAGEGVDAAQAQLAEVEGELATLCEAIGQPNIDACIDLFGAAAAAPAEDRTEPEPDPEPEPEPEPLPAPEPDPQPEPEPEPEPQPLPEPEPEPAPEPQPIPDPQPEPAPEPEPEPLPQPEPEPAPEPEPQPSPEPQPLPEPVPEPDQPVAPTPDIQPVPPIQEPEPAPAENAAPPRLAAAVESYETAVAAYDEAVAANRDIAAAADAVLAAEAELQTICQALGQSEIQACVAAFGVNLEIITPEVPPAGEEAQPQEPPADAAPVEEPPVPQERPEEIPDEAAPEDQADQDAGEQPAAPELPQEDVFLEDGELGELLPGEVPIEEIAPLLDSEKDQANAFAAGRTEPEPGAPAPDAQPAPEGQQPAQPVEPAEPVAPPATDADAQAAVMLEEIAPITLEAGTRRGEARAGEAPVTAQEREEAELIGRVPPQGANIIEQIGLSVVFEYNNNIYIESPDTPRYWYENDRDYYIEDLPGGRTREVIIRADGTQIVTIRDNWGEVVRRSRIEPDGREILLVYVDEDYRRYDDQGRWIDPGRELPPLRLTIPAREYVLDASAANEQQVAQFLVQPPVEQLQRYYTIEEVKRSARLRDMVRRLEVGDLTFATASATIPASQIPTLSAVANAMLDLLIANPAETFLIEGHTDAVGADLYNLQLSDARAQSVANALTTVYGIPPENLATQGYGERYLKVNTPVAEELNRRVTIRRITPLITPVAALPAG